MATYEGAAGIAKLKEKIKQKSKLLVGESAEKVAIHLVDNSPLGAEFYRSKHGNIENDVGDFKNSWVVGLGHLDPSTRAADSAGTAAVADAITKSKLYNLQENVYVTNSVEHAGMVEDGWGDNPEYGWKAKDGYHIVRDSEPTATAILQAVADKVSKM
jgi:hypothetical protein